MKTPPLLVVVCAAIFLLLAFTTVVESKYIKEHVKGKDFVFLGKFCYTKVPKEPNTDFLFVVGHAVINAFAAAGTLFWKIHNTPNPDMKLAFYDDEAQRWPSIYGTSASCAHKFAQSNFNVSIESQISEISPRNVYWPHFWYVVAVDCGASIDLDYEMTFLNSWGNDKWEKQFSCDEVGLEGLYMAYFILYVFGGVVHAYAVYLLIRSNSYHSIVKLLSTTIGLEGIYVFCSFVHYSVYANDGVGTPALKGIGDILDLFAQLVFILLLILVAKGWCITKTQLEDKKVVLIGLGVLVAAYLALFIWENVGLDPASTLYVYQSAPGIIILVLRGLAMLWFIWCLRITYLEENQDYKLKFYIWFGAMYILWFLCLPFITVIASSFKHAWAELKTVMILYVTANGLALAGLQYLLWPTRANEYFQISSRLDLAGTIPYDSI